MVITLEDRETLKAIIMEALALQPSPGHLQRLIEQPVRETRTEPAVEKKDMTVQQILDMVRAYRAALKKHDKVLAQYRNHPFDSKNASRAIENVRDELEKAEEGFKAFCCAVAAGSTMITRGT